MKTAYVLMLITALAAPVPVRCGGKPGGAAQKPGAAPATDAPVTLAAEGKKNPLPGGGWFTWQFDKKPRLGTVIVKVRIYSKEKKKDASCEVTGDSGMPSMLYHDTGPVKFKLNRKGDYLLPVDIVMPGEWRLVIRIKSGGKDVFAGKIDYNA